MADLDSLDRKLDLLLERGPTGPRFLSVSEAGKYASVSPDSVRRMLANGQLTPLRPVPGRVVVDREQLDSVILGSTGGKGSDA